VDLLTIDHTLCTGCGTCLDVCPTGAIRLYEDEYVSTIEPALCNECLECLDVCPNDAIQRVEAPDLAPALQGEVVEGEVIASEVIPVSEVGLPVRTRQPGQLAALAGTALTFIGSWLLPHAADVLLDAMERRLVDGASSAPSATPLRAGSKFSSRQMGGGGGGRFRQRRRRRRGR
jgi:NAD-dependent dihydropyrimidine dehydrogenase PreA subunit